VAGIDFDKADELATFYGTLVTPAESLAENPVFNLAAAYLSLRAPKGELAEARAELGAWLVEHPRHYIPDPMFGSNPKTGDKVLVIARLVYEDGAYGFEVVASGEGPTEAVAIRAALSRARGEGL
jgi:hypothetical protein